MYIVYTAPIDGYSIVDIVTLPLTPQTKSQILCG